MTATVTSLTLTTLKLAFLAVLYLFVWRVTRSIVVDLRSPRAPRPGPPQGAQPVPGPAPAEAAPAPAAQAAPAPARRKGKVPATIAILDEKGRKTRAFKLTGPIQIGRADACHLRLPDTYVSQFHARIYPQDDSWFVEDLGSTNGTFLNQRKVNGASEVRAGDRVRIGTTTLELRA